MPALLFVSPHATEGVWGVITDGAFPTRGTMVSYIHRWAEIYVSSRRLWKLLPNFVYEFLGWTGRMRTQFRLGCRYSNVERAVARLAPRPWLAIHGQKDAYIGVAIAEHLFERGGDPKELWVVPKAKHNRCREANPTIYAERLLNFFGQYAPRRVRSSPRPEIEEVDAVVAPHFGTGPIAFDFVAVPDDLGVPLPG